MDEDAILLERAGGKRSLSEMARGGRDDEATHIICDIIAELHAPRANPRPRLVPLSAWCRELEPAATTHGGTLVRSADTARLLLAEPRDIRALHGDIHHDNIQSAGSIERCLSRTRQRLALSSMSASAAGDTGLAR
jgi:streptomycin 6-kinase